MHSLFIKIKYFLNIKIYSWHYCKLCGILNGKLICNDCFSILSKVALDIIPVTDNWFFDKLYPSFVYQNPLPKVLHKFKYGKNLSLSWSLGYLLYSNLKNLDMDSIDYIIPVPIHPLKKKKRGFNQVVTEFGPNGHGYLSGFGIVSRRLEWVNHLHAGEIA